MQKLNRLDTGIMPLPDTHWERGKCGLKLIQYMTAGIPVISFPVGVNCEIVDHGLNGFLAANSEEWIEFLKRLKNNLELCRKMGAVGRKNVEESYSLEVIAPKLMNVLFKAVRV